MGASKIHVGVIGASGYSGEELVISLLRHPKVQLTRITSRQYINQPVHQIFPKLLGKCDLIFTPPDVQDLINSCEVVFLALPHGLAVEYAKPLFEKGVRVIDLSADFRLRDPSIYKEFYGEEHPAPELIPSAVYGLPEVYRSELTHARLVACAGCYVTSVLLPLIPLLQHQMIAPQGIRIASMSGVSGAGRKAEIDYLFAECNENLRAYKPVRHRHVCEIEQELRKAANLPSLTISFVPHLVPVTRGIHTTIFTLPVERITSATPVHETLEAYYRTSPFVKVLPLGKLPQTNSVLFSNTCQIGVAYDDRTSSILLFSVLDNLGKGAATQAIQCMNIMFNLEETAGLYL